MARRVLLALSMVVTTTILAIPAASAGPATLQCDPGVKVSAAESPKTVSVLDAGTADPLDVVDVVVTITGTHFEITAPETTPAVSYTLSDASWCLKVATKTDPANKGTGTTGDSAVYNKKQKSLQNIGYVTLYSVTTQPTTLAIAGCFLFYDDPGGTQTNYYVVTDGQEVQPLNGAATTYLDSGCSNAEGSVSVYDSWIWADSAASAGALCEGTAYATLTPNLFGCRLT